MHASVCVCVCVVCVCMCMGAYSVYVRVCMRVCVWVYMCARSISLITFRMSTLVRVLSLLRQ